MHLLHLYSHRVKYCSHTNFSHSEWHSLNIQLLCRSSLWVWSSYASSDKAVLCYQLLQYNIVELSNEYCFHVNTTQQLIRYHDKRWYQNGKYIMINSNNHLNSTVLIRQNSELQFSIEISNVTADDLGDYVGIIYGSIYDLTSWCRECRYSFFPFIWEIFYSQILTTVSFTSLEIYSKCINHNIIMITDIIKIFTCRATFSCLVI